MQPDLRSSAPAEPIPLWYVLPDGFHPVDLAADPQPRMEESFDRLSAVHPSATTDQLVAGVLSFESALARMVTDGLVHFSSFALRTEDDGLLTGLCQIFVVDRAPGDPNLYPRQVLKAQRTDDAASALHRAIVPLPCGPAAVTVADRVVPVPGACFGVAADGATEVRSVTFDIAFPGAPEAAALTLTTEALEYEEEFLEIATLVAAGISFTPPTDAPSPDLDVSVATGDPNAGEDIRNVFG
ncbi:hypothetical protein ACH4GK_06155 [Streptomyces rimosus]|uniref:hypothetical protein n=1 Tax=Streptomyces rimosus TaxID=1927 RepID=UPI0004C75D1F|nr:hypothetical protein [Streptomyces rimosus]